MASQLNPYLNFGGTTKEAMTFYSEVFGGTLNMQTFEQLHAAADPSENTLIMHSELRTPGGLTLMAADMPERMQFSAGNNFSLSLSGEDETELRGWFDKLAAGGSVDQPLTKAVWGDTFGMCTDKFGIRWLVNISAPQPAAAP